MTFKNKISNAARGFAAGLFLLSSVRAARAARPADLQPAPSRKEFQALLQHFVDQTYLKGFRHLGDERDFDHGHLLYDGHANVVAILYHTQELAADHGAGDGFGYVDSGARNWIQWVADGRIENAARYLRRDYPSTAAWDYFRSLELPALEAKHTVLPKMLDPVLGVDDSKTAQWVFTRVQCAGAAPASAAGGLRVILPTKEEVCLTLSAS